MRAGCSRSNSAAPSREYQAHRRRCVVWDSSNLGRVRVTGPGAFEVVQRTFTNDLRRTRPGRSQYTFLLSPGTAGVVDDLMVWWVRDEEFVLTPSRSNAVLDVLRGTHAGGTTGPCGIEDVAAGRVLLALQGARAAHELAALEVDLAELPPSTVREVVLDGHPVRIAATGFGRQLGFELDLPVAVARSVYRRLVDSGVTPAGLAMRETHRLEAGIPRYGFELGASISPMEAGSSRSVALDTEFVGRTALVARNRRGLDRILRAVVMDTRQAPPAGGVLLHRGHVVGRVTSGNYAPRLHRGLGFAFVRSTHRRGDRRDRARSARRTRWQGQRGPRRSGGGVVSTPEQGIGPSGLREPAEARPPKYPVPAKPPPARYRIDPDLYRVAEAVPARRPCRRARAVRREAARRVKVSQLAGLWVATDPTVHVEDRVVQDDSGHEVAVRIYRPRADSGPRPAVVYLHGGAFISGDLDFEHPRCLETCRETGYTVVAVDYRLAPEHPYPAGLDDRVAAYRWLCAKGASIGVETARIAIAGASAGGALTAALCIRARDCGLPTPALQMLLYPVTDDRLRTASVRMFTDTPTWDAPNCAHMWNHYLGPAERRGDVSPYAAPARATDLSGLPDAYVMTAELDPLRDEGAHYARALANAGVSTELHCFAGAFHAFDTLSSAPLSLRARREHHDVLRAGLGRNPNRARRNETPTTT
ncbi:alpha/beta hydrolase fold domain-containing protein [Streptomyces sp. L7]